jgi:trans-aconitate methyltransferase
VGLGDLVIAHDVTRHSGTPITLGPACPRLTRPFVARDDRLTALSIWLAASAEPAASAAFSLLDGDEERVIRRVPVRAQGPAGSWVRIPFEPVAGSRGKSFRLLLETNGGGPGLALWTSRRTATLGEDGGPGEERHLCFRTHYRRDTHAVVDPLLSRYVRAYPETPILERETLHEILRHGVCRDQPMLLQLLHLLEALNRTQRVRRVLSLGGGSGHREAYVAARFPEMRLDVDRGVGAGAVADRARVRRIDVDMVESPEEASYDLVVSIGRIGRAADPRTAFRNAAAKTRPGGWLYVSEPASAMDRRLLRDDFAASRYDLVLEGEIGDARLEEPLQALRETLDADASEREIVSFVRLLQLDLAPPNVEGPPSRGGIKALGRRRAGYAW